VRLLWFLTLVLGLAFAAAPEEVARRAVAEWLKGGDQATPEALLTARSEEALLRLLRFPPPPPGLQVNLEQPRVEPRGEEVWVRFPAALGERTGEVVVRLRAGKPVGIFFAAEGAGLPSWVHHPLFVALVFAVGFFLTHALFFGSLRPLLLELLELIRRWRWLFFLVQALLFGAFFLGVLLAYEDPELARALQDALLPLLSAIGLERAAQKSPLFLAVAIFYWNLSRGLLLTTALPALLFGVPALILNFFRYLVFGFALSPAVVPPERFLWHLPVVVLELGAYNLAIFGGFVILAEVVSGRGFRAGLRAFGRLLIVAAVLLFWAALYEAFEVSL